MFDILHRRMAMHDGCAKVTAMAEEGFANPDQVILVLVMQRRVGMDAGMNEEIVADMVGEAAGLGDEAQMVFGDSRGGRAG